MAAFGAIDYEQPQTLAGLDFARPVDVNQIIQAQQTNPLGVGNTTPVTTTGVPSFNFGTPGVAPGAGGPTMWNKFFGSKETGPGMAMPALGLLQGGLNFYLGKENLDLAKESLATSKQQFADQFGLQKQEINRDIRDLGDRRYARNPTANPTGQQYFDENRIL